MTHLYIETIRKVDQSTSLKEDTDNTLTLNSHEGMSAQKYVVVGAGPVGSLAALYAAKRGHDVEIYELRGGMFISSKTDALASKHRSYAA